MAHKIKPIDALSTSRFPHALFYSFLLVHQSRIEPVQTVKLLSHRSLATSIQFKRFPFFAIVVVPSPIAPFLAAYLQQLAYYWESEIPLHLFDMQQQQACTYYCWLAIAHRRHAYIVVLFIHFSCSQPGSTVALAAATTASPSSVEQILFVYALLESACIIYLVGLPLCRHYMHSMSSIGLFIGLPRLSV